MRLDDQILLCLAITLGAFGLSCFILGLIVELKRTERRDKRSREIATQTAECASLVHRV